MSGVFGVYSPSPVEAADLTYLGLYALQHRGQESAGIAVFDGSAVRVHKGPGPVSRVFDEASLKGLPGRVSVGHVRHAERGAPSAADAQPLVGLLRHGQLALAHDGSVVNAGALRRELLEAGVVFQTETSAEVILHLIAAEAGVSLEEAICRAARRLVGSYAIGIVGQGRLIGIRDPLGIRPLAVGRSGDAWFVASESCAFDAAGAELVRDVAPGEMVVIDEEGLRSLRFAEGAREAMCVFEFIYFARPDSVIDGKTVHEVRKEIGRRLARKVAIEADVVIAAPDSASSAALGFAETAGIPFDVGLATNRYVGRTFIQPTPAMRRRGVHIKHNPIVETLRGKRVILVDDSIVRGTTSRRMIRLLKEAGVKEVHMVVASPPFSHPCLYGIDVPSSDQLIAAGRSVNEVCRLIGADSLHYLDFESLYQAVGVDGRRLCAACFGAPYPTPVDGGASQGGDVLAKGRM